MLNSCSTLEFGWCNWIGSIDIFLIFLVHFASWLVPTLSCFTTWDREDHPNPRKLFVTHFTHQSLWWSTINPLIIHESLGFSGNGLSYFGMCWKSPASNRNSDCKNRNWEIRGLAVHAKTWREWISGRATTKEVT